MRINHLGCDDCYQILKDLPKFDPTTTRINTQRYPFNGNQTSSLSKLTVCNNINLSEDSSIDIESPSERPLGRKGKKQQLKKKSRVNSVAVNSLVVKSAEKFIEQYVKSVEQN